MKKMSKAFMVFIIILNLFLYPGSTVNATTAPVVKRIGGNNRVLTSVNVSKNSFKTSDTVILVGYNGEIDALGGTLLASRLNAPILMTAKDSLTDQTKLEIQRLGARNIVILGGEGAVSKDVVKSLDAYSVERIDGYDREDTAIKIAKKAVGENVDEVFLSLGYDVYADALAIGPITAKLNKPLLLSKKMSISDSTEDALRDLKVKKVTIVGGMAVVPKSIEEKLKSMDIIVDRIYGNNREETSIKIAEEYLKDPSEVILANGYVFPDSVIGGYFAYKKNAPIILTRKDKLVDSTFRYIDKTKKDVHILGLYNAVGDGVERYLNVILKTSSFKAKFFLLPKTGKYESVEAGKMMDRVMNISPKIINSIYNAGVRMKFCNGPITDEPEYRDLKGQVPRGWEGLGKTWDDVPGAGGTITPIARIGYSEPSTKNGHSSINLELHELAHSIDNYTQGSPYGGYKISNVSNFNDIWMGEVRNILPDFYYISYREEYFAEAFAMYYLSEETNSNLKKKAPKTHAFIKRLDLTESYVVVKKMMKYRKVDLQDAIKTKGMIS
ncbi:cell wall-binding repeat-containing protein [Tissierella creatinophila]|uniref:N-acetylmuramoyl-L-alanine amidase LytC n=1 Tax=Tissierella creatinophila DSM 6911 TaxID=1123403 RepID=A0A1U7M5M8_TISCR|nr:cell wall-binding repeat-containing protein [Tissierella creatinophila]OLS02617.1 N-acetylmuramoyl-L-alanine amidase LytC precursor [Tissierella creatinophila DSM 6911]